MLYFNSEEKDYRVDEYYHEQEGYTFLLPSENARKYSFEEKQKISPSEQIDMAERLDILPIMGSIKLANKTPRLLKYLGAQDLPIYISQRHVRDVVATFSDGYHQHGISKEQLLAAPMKANNPLFVFDASRKDDSICIFLDMFAPDRDGGMSSPIVMPIHLNGTEDGHPVNYVTSIYGKRLFGTFRLLENAINDGTLLYANVERLQEIAEEFGHPNWMPDMSNIPSKQILKHSPIAKETRENPEKFNNQYTRLEELKKQHSQTTRSHENKRGERGLVKER